MVKKVIERLANEKVLKGLKRSPAVALLGPRQCGKSTLAKSLIESREAVYLDLQDRTDLNKLKEPELFFEQHRDKLICLDEIQLVPELFSFLRSEIDRDRRKGRFLLLGSASRDLISQTSETLAGRVAFIELTPFLITEIGQRNTDYSLWLRGGYPDSYLAEDEDDSFEWRQDYIRTFLERDIPALGLQIPIPIIERLWRMLAHYHGQTVNYSKLASSLDVSVQTLKRYLGILEQTYVVRLLQPFHANLKKRMVKAPKVFLRDSGLLHALLDIETYDDLLGYPDMGASWEGYVSEQLIASAKGWHPAYLRTSNGAEVDLVLEKGGKKLIFEFKASKAPKPRRGLYELLKDLGEEKGYLVAPVEEGYFYNREVEVLSVMGAVGLVSNSKGNDR